MVDLVLILIELLYVPFIIRLEFMVGVESLFLEFDQTMNLLLPVSACKSTLFEEVCVSALQLNGAGSLFMKSRACLGKKCAKTLVFGLEGMLSLCMYS